MIARRPLGTGLLCALLAMDGASAPLIAQAQVQLQTPSPLQQQPSQETQAQTEPPPRSEVPTQAPIQAQTLRVPAAEILAAAMRPFEPPTPPVAPLTLDQAVRLTLQFNPNIARARRDLVAAEGRVRETRGAFDFTVRAAPGYAYLQQELTPSLRAREIDKRNQLRAVQLTFDGINQAVRESLASLSPRPPLCPPLLELGRTPEASNSFTTDRRDPLDVQLAGLDRDFQRDSPLRGTGAAGGASGSGGILLTSVGPIRLSDICRPSNDLRGPETTADLWRRLSETGGVSLGAAADGLSAFQTELLRFTDHLSNTIATRSRLSLQRLGLLPEDEVRKLTFVEASLSKPLRSGLAFSLDLRLESEERNYKDKPLDPSFGGLEIRPRFPAFLSGTLEMPLRKGLGRISAGAPERAAILSARAQRDQLRQIAAEETFRTVLAYVTLAATQARVRLLGESEARQQRLLKLTDELIAVDEVPAIDRARSQARAGTVGQALTQSRLSLIAARASLIDVMGVQAGDLSQGPVAADDLFGGEELTPAAPLPGLPGAATWLQLARVERADPRALRLLRDAAGILAAAARNDLKRRVDLSITGGLTTLYESPYARFLPDEVNPVVATDGVPAAPGRPVSYYSLRGWGRSFDGEWRPFVRAAITFDLPFGNRAAKGRAEQAAASQQRSAIESTNLDRLIEQHVNNASQIARTAADTIERRRATIAFQRQALDGALARFEIGEITLLDTLVTEQDLTDERLQLAGDLLIYFSALSRVKFESGTLLRFERVDDAAETMTFEPLLQVPGTEAGR